MTRLKYEFLVISNKIWTFEFHSCLREIRVNGVEGQVDNLLLTVA